MRKASKLLAIALAAVAAALCAAAAVAAAGFIRYENPANMLQAFFGENVDSHEGIVEYNEYGKLITNMPAWWPPTSSPWANRRCTETTP